MDKSVSSRKIEVAIKVKANDNDSSYRYTQLQEYYIYDKSIEVFTMCEYSKIDPNTNTF